MFIVLRKILKVKDPIVKHALLSWAEPFAAGSGRVNRTLLAKDLDYNLDIVNQILDQNYDNLIDSFLERCDIRKYIST